MSLSFGNDLSIKFISPVITLSVKILLSCSLYLESLLVDCQGRNPGQSPEEVHDAPRAGLVHVLHEQGRLEAGVLDEGARQDDGVHQRRVVDEISQVLARL